MGLTSAPPPSHDTDPQLNPKFEQAIQRMHRLTLYGRWGVVLVCWVVFAPLSLWSMQDEFALWHDYFTWSAFRFSLAYHPWATLGLALCFGMTLSTLIWQSRNILWGLPQRDRHRLEQIVCQIHKQGSSHPLWKWVYPSSPH
jgi:hypothetical protein